MNRYDLSLLFSRAHSEQKSVLSVYLNVDQSQSRNINRGFETQLKKMATRVRTQVFDVAEHERFSAAMHHIQDFIAASSPTDKGVVMFYDTVDKFFWHQAVGFDLTDRIRWGREPLLQPLAAAIDEMETCGVVLVDRAKARFFIVSLGEIEEVATEDRSAKRVRHIKTSGFDNPASSSHIQRKADNQVRKNLQESIRELDALLKAKRLHRLVLAGRSETTAELRKLLPVRLALNVIGEIALPTTATSQQVLSATLALETKYERQTELEKVNRIVTSAAKNGKSVVGLNGTLKAINSDRVWELIYAGGILAGGSECPKCSALFATRATRCIHCGSRRVEPVEDVIERAVERALRKQARIEVVTADAAKALKSVGGIGAFLKTSTGTLAI